jgi:hypothetical protein
MNTSVVPQEGAPGSAVSGSPAQAETIPNDPGTIVASTAIQTLDQMLHANWIYDATFSVTTTQPPGTILHYIRIHPDNCNYVNKYVAKLFNVFTGSQSIRYRPLATVFYGGSIRVGFLPPTVAETDITKIPLDVLTTFPNRDIDPKNTGWVEFTPPDQRNIMYHHMSDDSPQGFGGWVVFYVAGRLVTQSPEFNTVQFIVEQRGGFMFDQPNPAAIAEVQSGSHPMTLACQLPLEFQPLNDHCRSGAEVQVQVESTSIVNIQWPGMQHAAYGIHEVCRVQKPAVPFVQRTTVPYKEEYQFQACPPYNKGGGLYGLQPYFMPVNFAFGSYTAGNHRPVACSGTDGQTWVPPDHIMMVPFENGTEINFMANDHPSQDHCTYGSVYKSSQFDNEVPPLLAIEDMTGRQFFSEPIPTIPHVSKPLPNESIVVFTHNRETRYATQTSTMAYEIGNWKGDTPNSLQTYLYQLLAPDSETPLIYLRLWPNGIITTNGTVTRYTIAAKGCKIRFLQALLATEPLPPAPPSSFRVRELSRMAASKTISLAELASELKCL